MNTQIHFAFPYQQTLQQMVLFMPIEKMKDYCFGGVFTWDGIANLHLHNSCQNVIPLVVFYQNSIVGYFSFERDAFNLRYITNAEMILFNAKRSLPAFTTILDILKENFGIKYITFATIQGGVADKYWRRTYTIGKYDVVHSGILRGACVNTKQEIKDKNLFQIIL